MYKQVFKIFLFNISYDVLFAIFKYGNIVDIKSGFRRITYYCKNLSVSIDGYLHFIQECALYRSVGSQPNTFHHK